MKDIQPENAPNVADNDDAYGRMLSGIRGLRLAIVEVEAKFKFDDANSIELRERVTANLEAHPPTIGQNSSSRRLVTGNCKTFAVVSQVGEIPTFT
jgi:transcriptional regulator